MVSLHCPHHTSWARMACWMGHSATGPPAPACHDRKSRCFDSAISGDFLCLPTGSPSSLLCIGSATRENLSLTSSHVSRTTLSTCKGLCLQTTGPAEMC